MINFLKTTIIGGLVFLVPFAVLVVVLQKIVPVAKKIGDPVAELIPLESILGFDLPIVLAFLIILLSCFLVGLVAKTKAARRLVTLLETSLVGKIPGYSLLKSITTDIAETDGNSSDRVVLVRLDDAWQLGLRIEELDDGKRTAVFIPDSPTPETGAVLVVNAERIKSIDIPIMAAFSCLRGRGTGIGQIIEGGAKA